MQFAAAAMQTMAAAFTPTAAAGLTTASSFGLFELAGAGTAAGFNAASAAAGGAAAIGGASFFASLLEGTATVASALAAVRAGESDASVARMQADDAELDAQLEGVQGLERRNSLRRALIETIGDRDVAAAASGVDLTFGTPAIARQEAVRDTERALNVDRSTEEFRKTRLLERARNFRSIAGEKTRGGFAKAAGIGLGGLASVARRG